MQMNEMHVLVIEDDPFQNQLIASMTESLGAKVSQAGDGRQALEIITRSQDLPVNLILCDLKMPEMDGMEFLRHLGQLETNVAVIILSGLESKLLVSVAKMARMYGIKLLGTLEKPVTLAQLKELLATHQQVETKWDHRGESRNFSLAEVLEGVRSNQFEPYFQPKVELKSGRLIGAEALARWIHPEHGVIHPVSFIPLLEQSSQIDAITFQMIEKTAQFCRSLLDGGHHFSLSVNLSLSSLNDPTLAERITSIVNNCGIDPLHIVIEITESAAMTDTAAALENLARLCMNGFQLSIDDYGTGYSSLQQLTRIAFSELKIDQGFVKDLTDSDSLRIIVKSSVDMAHQLRIKSVAEGIESIRDWNTLHSLDCDIGQGYFIAKPMSGKDFYKFVVSYDPIRPNPDQAVSGQQSSLRILVVEDDAFTRRLIVQILHQLGFLKVMDTDSAEVAIKLFENNAFDLVVTDLGMPGMNGLQFIQSIRAGQTLAKPDIRILILTAISQIDVIGAALAMDINGFVVKPISPAVLEEKINKALSERMQLHPPIAYAAILSEFRALSDADAQLSTKSVSASITKGEPKPSAKAPEIEGHVSLTRLRPGMMLKADVHLSNGTLILSSGRILTEASINRLNDIQELLRETSFLVQEL